MDLNTVVFTKQNRGTKGYSKFKMNFRDRAEKYCFSLFTAILIRAPPSKMREPYSNHSVCLSVCPSVCLSTLLL